MPPKPTAPQRLYLHQLIENPKNERKTFRNMDGLIETVRALGVIERLTVAPHCGNQYMIVTGHRRYRAAKAAGMHRVPVHIVDPADAHTRRHKSIVSNVQHEDLPPLELAEALQALLDEDPNIKTQRDLARLIGKRET